MLTSETTELFPPRNDCDVLDEILKSDPRTIPSGDAQTISDLDMGDGFDFNSLLRCANIFRDELVSLVSGFGFIAGKMVLHPFQLRRLRQDPAYRSMVGEKLSGFVHYSSGNNAVFVDKGYPEVRIAIYTSHLVVCASEEEAGNKAKYIRKAVLMGKDKSCYFCTFQYFQT